MRTRTTIVTGVFRLKMGNSSFNAEGMKLSNLGDKFRCLAIYNQYIDGTKIHALVGAHNNDNDIVYYVESDFYSYATGLKIWTTDVFDFYYPMSAFITSIADSNLSRKTAYIVLT